VPFVLKSTSLLRQAGPPQGSLFLYLGSIIKEHINLLTNLIGQVNIKVKYVEWRFKFSLKKHKS